MNYKRTLLTLAVGSSTFMCWAKSSPNLLIILTDEHNFRTLGCYRELLSSEAAMPWGPGVFVDTPNLDELAKDGAVCNNFYATFPVSSPSRSSMMSGMYPNKTGVVHNDLQMNLSIETFASTLLKNGYRTGYAGKWHLDGADKPGWEPKEKFGFEDNRYMFNRGHWKVLDFKDGEPIVVTDEKGVNLKALAADEKTFTTDFLCDRTVEYIEEHKNEKFCYVVSIPDPHTPNTARSPYDTMYLNQPYQVPKSAADTGLPAWIQNGGKAYPHTDAEDPVLMAGYWGMVKCIDDNVGKIIKKLKDEGLYENTIIVFTADHGDMLGEHHRDNKNLAFEASAKIPFIIYCNGKIDTGRVLPAAMNNADFAPTILSLLGVDSDVEYDGRDMSKYFKSGKLPKNWNNITTFYAGNSWVACTDGNYKIICKQSKDGISDSVEPILFDIINDPLEMTNIYGTNKAPQEVISKLMVGIDNFCEKHKHNK